MVRLERVELPPGGRQVVVQVQVALVALVREDVLEAVQVGLEEERENLAFKQDLELDKNLL